MTNTTTNDREQSRNPGSPPASWRWWPSLVLLVVVLLIPIAPASAQICWPETQQMTPGLGSGYVFAGMSVSVSGGVMVVGIADDDGPSGLGGDAFIYLRDPQTNQWAEVQHLQDTAGGTVGDHFGYSVSVSGAVRVIGEPGNTPLDTGRVFVYERDPQSGLWLEVEQLAASSPFPGNTFGASVGVSGDVLVVGAFDYINGSNQGSVYIFERDINGAWLQTQELSDLGGVGSASGYGSSVSIMDDVIVVGQPYDDVQGIDSGSVLVYELDNLGFWQETQKLLQPGGTTDDRFGKSVDICNDVIAIGVPGDDDQGPDSGSAFVFERDNAGTWQPTALPLPSGGAPVDHFGSAVSISANTIVIGSQWDDDQGPNSGSAFVYQRDTLTGPWLEREKLLASDGAQDFWFGSAVSISGETIAVAGGYYFVNGGGPGWPIGRTYLYTLDPGCQLPSLEVCDNGIDDDCDGWIDCDDTDCADFFSFIDSEQALGDSDSFSVAMGDLNGDGYRDAVVANYADHINRLWLNDGQNSPGTFTDSGQVLGGDHCTDVVLGDLDGDNDLDIFFTNRLQTGGAPNRVWINDGGVQGGTPGDFTDSGQQLGNNSSLSVDLGDIDNDGDLDAFVGNFGNNRVWINDGTGTFTSNGQSLGTSVNQSVVLGDLDEDGDLDAFAASYIDNQVWLNNGFQQGGTLGTFSAGSQVPGNGWSYDATLGYLNNDNFLDVFIAEANGQPNIVLFNDGTGNFINSGQALGNSWSRAVELGDLDGDNDLDAFVGNSNSFPNRVWINDGGIQGGSPGTFSDSGMALGDSVSYAIVLDDVDLDGDLDAFVGNYAFPNEVWLNSNLCNPTDCNSNGIPDETEEDCNGNGIPDDCDIENGTAQDANNNQIPDECELCQQLGDMSVTCHSDGGVLVTFLIANLSGLDAHKLFLPGQIDYPTGSAFISPTVTIFDPALPGDGSVSALIEFVIDGADGGAQLLIPFALMHKDDEGNLQECCNGTLDIGIPDGCDATQFVRGDSNQDGDIDIADAVAILNYLFNFFGTLCVDANDANDSGTVSITDAVNVLCLIFCPGAPLPPTPFPECGPDPTPDPLGCVSFPSCQ